MRVVVLGGTRFVGRAITRPLAAAGHAVLIVHRGQAELITESNVTHLHARRSSWPDHRAAFHAFSPDVAIDVSAGNAAGAHAALSALPRDIRLVALSSIDVYRAYQGLHSQRQTDAVPLTEDSPLRTSRYIDGPQWENLDIEQHYLEAGAIVLRLGAVYGEHDYLHRFEPVLRRIRAARARMPVGTGSFLFSRVYVGDVAQAVLAALHARDGLAGCFNIVEAQTAPMRLFYEQIVASTGSELELVRVPDAVLPVELRAGGGPVQHLLASPLKARDLLGWRDSGLANFSRSVRWHLAHPPDDWNRDFSADDASFAAAG